MTTTTATIQGLATTALGFFETRTRDNGEQFVTTNDRRPEWVQDLCMSAHGDFLPEDWRYEKIMDALEAIAGTDPDDRDSAEDARHEFADGAVDVYNADRYRWLASNLNRAGYCDEAADDVGDVAASITERIGWGQYAEAEEIYGLVLAALEGERDLRDV